MANIALQFSVDTLSMAKIGHHGPEPHDPPLDARLQAAFRQLVPDEPPHDPIRQAALLADDGFIKERELADRLQVSLSLVQHWRSGDCGPPFFKLGESKSAPVRYSWPEVLAWLRENFRVRPAAPKLPHKTVFQAGVPVTWEFAE